MIVMVIKMLYIFGRPSVSCSFGQLVLNVCPPNLINDTAAFSDCVQDTYFFKSKTWFY